MDQERLSAVLVEFARTLVEDFSIQDILDRLARRVIEVIPTDGAGVLLLDERGPAALRPRRPTSGSW